MEGLFRRKPEGTNFEFKLHFHASRVPTFGWDKLVVSLLSIETGRITVKSSRGIVRDGACQWPDPVLESTNLFQNPSTKKYDDKFYKLFVQMGSLRAGILGEATINFAEYVAAEALEAVSLPLRNCSAGTILHLKIQRLTPKAVIRDTEGQRISMLDQEFPGSVSEDNSSSSDMSEYLTSGTLGSFATQNIANQSAIPAYQHKNSNLYLSVLQKDVPATVGALQPNSDIDDTSSYTNASSISSKGHAVAKVPSHGFQNHVLDTLDSSADTDLYKSPETNKIIQPKSRRGDLNFSNLQSMQAELMNAKINPSSKEFGVWMAGNLPQRLEAAEATIRDLQEQNSAWERQARKLAVEVETFKQKLAQESRIGSDLKMKLSTAEKECNSLNSEIKQLKALKVRRHDGAENINRREVEDFKRVIKVLQEEIQDGKDVNANLKMQLSMTQDSNVNLLTAMTELELILEVSNKDVEKLKEANQHLEEELFNAKREFPQTDLTVEDFDAQPASDLEQECTSSTVEATLSEKEQRRSQTEELTQAQQLCVKDENVAELRLSLEESTKMQSALTAKIDESMFQISDLQGKILVLKEERLALGQERGDLMQKLEKETHARKDLEAEVVKLGKETEKFDLDVAARDKCIGNLNAELAETKAEKLALNGALQNLLEERQVLSNDTDAEKACMLEKLQETHAENNRQAQRLEEIVAEMQCLSKDLDIQLSKNEILESKRSEFLMIEEELEAKIAELEESNSSLLKRSSDLEMQLSVASQDQANSMHILETFKSERVSFEIEISRLQTHQKLLEQELQGSARRCTEIQDELADVEMKMRQCQQDSEDRECSLRLEISSILTCKTSLDQAAKRAEDVLCSSEQNMLRSLDLLQSRLEFLSMIVGEKKNAASNMMAKIGNLQAEKMDFENSLRLMEAKANDFEQLSVSLKGLDIKLKDAFIELVASKSLCSDLTEKLGEKESVLHELLLNQAKQEKDFEKKVGLLERELLEKATMLSELESKLLLHENGSILTKATERVDTKVVFKLEERLQCLEAEVEASKKEVMACKEDSRQTEIDLIKKIKGLEAANEHLAAGLTDSGAEQLQQEIIRLQNQNSGLSRREQELLSQMHTQEVLQEEVKRLQEGNDLLELRLSKFVKTAKNPLLLEKIVNLETELAEAVEENHEYRLQLKSVLDKQQLGDLDQIADSLCKHKKKAAQLQGELDSMHDRYTLLSIKLAEAEAGRGELMIALRNLKGMIKK